MAVPPAMPRGPGDDGRAARASREAKSVACERLNSTWPPESALLRLLDGDADCSHVSVGQLVRKVL